MNYLSTYNFRFNNVMYSLKFNNNRSVKKRMWQKWRYGSFLTKN